MKTLKNILIAMVFAIGFNSAYGNQTSQNEYRASMNTTVQSYINGVCLGQPAEFNKVIDENAVLNTLRGNRIVSITKRDQLNELKKLKGTQQNCKPSYSIIEDRENYAVAKVEMKYESFTKINYLTMKFDGTRWGISQVYTTFE